MGLSFSSCTSRFKLSTSSPAGSSNKGSNTAAETPDVAGAITAPRSTKAGQNPTASALPKASPDAAKVLLVDGTVLKFKSPVKVMKVLVEHPQHLICPLDSLKPGVHSLSSMMPDDDLKLGHLYLLLPSKAFRKPAGNRGGNHVPPESAPEPQPPRRKSAKGVHKSSAKGNNNNNILIIAEQKGGRKSDHHHSRRVSSASCAGMGGGNAVESNHVAYHHRSSVGLRRCRTWAPRLQPIEEAQRSGGNS